MQETKIKDISLRDNAQENLQKLLNFCNNGYETVNLVVFDEMLDKNEYAMLSEFYQKYKDEFDINVIVKHVRQNYPNDDIVEKVWDLQSVIRANKYIYDICDYIKKKNLSPLESLAYVHMKVQKISEYTPSVNRSWHSDDQYFVGAFLDKAEFVCAGFCDLEYNILKKLDLKGLECKVMSCNFYNFDKNTSDNHARLKLYICDDKYNICGHFYSDPTWDNDNLCDVAKYCHMLMSHECHEMSNKYDFRDFEEMSKDENNRTCYSKFYPEFEYLNESDKPILQKTIESAVFEMISKTSEKSFDELYCLLERMAKETFLEQKSRKFRGSFCQENVLLKKDEAYKIYKKYHKNVKNNEKIG